MRAVKVSAEQARRMALKAQLLNLPKTLSPGKAGVAEVIDRLGYVQIDTIAVVERSHNHTLWTRRPDYHKEMLHELQAKDRIVFEYWGHAMSYLPMRDYRYFLPKMKNFHNPSTPWAKHQLEKCKRLLKPVLKRIQEEGPLGSRDFESNSKKTGAWWDWKPAKVALEFLFWRGELMVCERRNFQKIYDLRERVLPDHIDTSMPKEEEIGHFLVKRALAAMGIADHSQIIGFLQPGAARDSDWQMVSRDTIRKSILDLAESGHIVQVGLDAGKGTHFCLTASIEEAEGTKPPEPTLSILSPFDNLLTPRKRVKELFDFDYRLECYLPAAKRKYGYFVMPILQNWELVGRLDPKADRKNKLLVVEQLRFEPGFREFEPTLPRLANKLIQLAAFNGCENIQIKKVLPQKINKAVRSALDLAMK